MAFQKRKLYHTPEWYSAHCANEAGGSPMFRFMLKNDMAFIGADNDSHFRYQEKIDTYEETWKRIFSKWKLEDPEGVLLPEMTGAMEREALKGYPRKESEEPQVQVAKKPRAGGTARKVERKKLKRRIRLGRRYFDDPAL